MGIYSKYGLNDVYIGYRKINPNSILVILKKLFKIKETTSTYAEWKRNTTSQVFTKIYYNGESEEFAYYLKNELRTRTFCCTELLPYGLAAWAITLSVTSLFETNFGNISIFIMLILMAISVHFLHHSQKRASFLEDTLAIFEDYIENCFAHTPLYNRNVGQQCGPKVLCQKKISQISHQHRKYSQYKPPILLTTSHKALHIKPFVIKKFDENS